MAKSKNEVTGCSLIYEASQCVWKPYTLTIIAVYMDKFCPSLMFFVFDILFVLTIILHWTAFKFMFLNLGVYCAICVWTVLKFIIWSDVLHLQRFLMLHLFYFEFSRTNFFRITVYRQKWILAKSNRDREGNTCVFNRNYTDSYILSYPLSVGSYTLSYL